MNVEHEKTRGRHRIRSLRLVVGAGLIAAAVASELSKPKGQRTRHGRIAGLVPYDFRNPSLRRFRDTYWNPRNDHYIVPKAFGAGWTVNMGRVFRRWA